MAKRTPVFKKLLEGNNPLVAGIALIMFITLSVILGSLIFSGKDKAPITQDQIMIQKGGNTIIVNKNGLIEYRSGDEVFYKTWDSSRISYFFTRMQTKARDYLKSGTTGPCDGCYAVTLYVDGKLVTIYVSDDEDLDQAFEDFPDGGDDQDGSISDYFDEGGDGSGSGDDSTDYTQPVTPTPTGTFLTSPTPTPTPIYQGGGQTNYPPVEAGCSAWSQDIVDKAIISNTLCTVVEE